MVLKKKLGVAAVGGLYRFFTLFPQQHKVCFLSKHALEPLDFRLLRDWLRANDPSVKTVCIGVKSNNSFSVGEAFRQVWHAATSKVCVVDSYIPAVCIPDKKHRATTLQLWHALGAIKKFGYQTKGQAGGRSDEDAALFKMHRGYDYVIAGQQGACAAFAEAFDMPAVTVLPLGSPHIDYLRAEAYAEERQRCAREAWQRGGVSLESLEGRIVVLYVPTFRPGVHGSEWLQEQVAALAQQLSGERYVLAVAAHPQDNAPAAGSSSRLAAADPALQSARQPLQMTAPERAQSGSGCEVRYVGSSQSMDLLPRADYVITDYSSIAFESAVLQKKTLFYTFDRDAYSEAPGLNVDPCRDFPSVAYSNARDLCGAIRAEVERGVPLPQEEWQAFARCYAGVCAEGSVEKICAFIQGFLA